MTFVTAGLAIAGACAVVIPIIIHLLFRQRRKPIEWAAMRFLIEAYRKHRKRLRLEQLLLLAVRCLIPLVLGFALARPLLQGALAPSIGGQRAVYLIIDDGLASSVTDEQETKWTPCSSQSRISLKLAYPRSRSTPKPRHDASMVRCKLSCSRAGLR
jgi:hypothetical protein